MAEVFYTTPDIAKICRVSRMTVNRWLKDGYLRGYRPTANANWRITKQELKKFMLSNHIPLDLLKSDNEVKILVVDDNIDLTTSISNYLENERNLKIDVANSGFKAGVKLSEFNPDIIILDIILGDIDGREFFQHIEENDELNGTKVIGISGNIDMKEEQPLIDMGFNAFLRKPFRMKALKDLIYQLLEG